MDGFEEGTLVGPSRVGPWMLTTRIPAMYQRMKFNYTIATAGNRLDLHIMWTDEPCFNVIFVMWTMVVGSEVRYKSRTNLPAKPMSDRFGDGLGLKI